MNRLALASALTFAPALPALAQTNTYPFPASGNVGIGTTAPAPDINAYNSVPLTLGGGLVDTSPGSTETSCSITQVFQQNVWNSPVGTIRVRGNLYRTWSTEMAFGVRNGENSLIEPLVLKASGNVGIGTTAPDHKLDVQGNIRTWGAFYLPYATDAAPYGMKSVSAVSSPSSAGTSLFANSAYPSEVSLGGMNGAGTYSPHLTVITGNQIGIGNVGIGTTNPTHKLAVNGTIKAKEVIVETTGWSDYVFADDYALQPLSEVEAHIKANKHLPGIPSATQVANEGVSVGDMQARLLAKIEELTLHQIAQQKLLAEQASELNALRSQVHALRERVGE